MKVTLPPNRYNKTVIPHIMINGAAEAIGFYQAAFDATEVFRITDGNGKIIHAELDISGALIMLSDADGIFKDPNAVGPSVGLHVYVNNVDELFDRAINAGGIPLQAVGDMFYGDRMGMLRDPFGHIWMLLTHQEDMTPEEIKRKGELLLKQHAPQIDKSEF